MMSSLPKRLPVGTGELPNLVDRLLDERHPVKSPQLDENAPPSDPIERLKALIKKTKA